MRHSGESSQGFFLKFSSPNFCRDFLFDMTKAQRLIRIIACN